ncbi:hypothetical protein N0Y54_42160 [Nostoc punctiforme UO1]|uniref:DUF3846 domain-containing protein n=1 Tax=Nostoc punctiforme TaxID=272131 RepID=UPI0030ABE031
MAILINILGTEEEIILESLEQIQEFIDGYFEQIDIEGGLLMVNENAIERNLPVNEKASVLAKQPIRGNVIFATHTEVAS